MSEAERINCRRCRLPTSPVYVSSSGLCFDCVEIDKLERRPRDVQPDPDLEEEVREAQRFDRYLFSTPADRRAVQAFRRRRRHANRHR